MENQLTERTRLLLNLGLHVRATHDAVVAARGIFTAEETAYLKQHLADMVEVIQPKIER